MIQGSIIITLPIGRGEPEGGLREPLQLDLALRVGGTGATQARSRKQTQKSQEHRFSPVTFFFVRSLAWFFRAEDVAFP